MIKEFLNLEQKFIASSNKPLVGFLCLRVPVELIEAYGALPLRIISKPNNTPSPLNFIRNDACSFCRSVPSVLKTSPYSEVKAVIAGACCDQMRRLTETLGKMTDVPVFFFGAPRTWGSDRDYFIKEMLDTFSNLGKELNLAFNENELISLIKKRRELETLINQKRTEGSLPTKLLHLISASPLPASQIISFLESNACFDLNNTHDLPLNSPSLLAIRILLMGSIPSGRELEIIEEYGGEVTADATCLGDRVFHNNHGILHDPYSYLFNRYIEGNLCPHRRPYQKLIEYIRNLIKERKIEGVISRP